MSFQHLALHFHGRQVSDAVWMWVDGSTYWANGVDVARVLGYKKAMSAVREHVSDEFRSTWSSVRGRIVPSDVVLPLKWYSSTILVSYLGIMELMYSCDRMFVQEFRLFWLRAVCIERQNTNYYVLASNCANDQRLSNLLYPSSPIREIATWSLWTDEEESTARRAAWARWAEESLSPSSSSSSSLSLSSPMRRRPRSSMLW